MHLTAILQEASQALCANDADLLERLCSTAEQARPCGTPDDRAEAVALLSVLRRQVLAARSNIVLRQRLLGMHTETPWVP